MWEIRAVIRNSPELGARFEVVQLPVGDNKMAEVIKKLGHDVLDAQVYMTGVSPKELSSLCGKLLDLDELNYLAKRMETLEGRDMDVFRAVMDAYKPESVKEAINITFNLDCYSLSEYEKSFSEIGRDYMITCNGCVKPTDDLVRIGERLINNGEGVHSERGYVFRTDNDFYEDYKGTTFPELPCEASIFEIRLDYGENSELLRLPCDDLTIFKAVKRLGAALIDDCVVSYSECSPAQEAGFRELCPEFDASDLPELNRLAAIYSKYGEKDFEKFVSVMGYIGRGDLDAMMTIAQNFGAFHFVSGVSDEKGPGAYIAKEECNAVDRLEGYIDYEHLGTDTVRSENGEFIEDHGYVGMKDGISLDEIIEIGGSYDYEYIDDGMVMQ